MKGKAFIDGIRSFTLLTTDPSEAMQIAHLLADAVEIADEGSTSVIQCNAAWLYVPEDWWDTGKISACPKARMDRALSYLDRRGLIERHPEKSHLVRFVEGA